VWIAFALWGAYDGRCGPARGPRSKMRLSLHPTRWGDTALGNDVPEAITTRRCVLLVDGIGTRGRAIPAVGRFLRVFLGLVRFGSGASVFGCASRGSRGSEALSGLGGKLGTRVRLRRFPNRNRAALALRVVFEFLGSAKTLGALGDRKHRSKPPGAGGSGRQFCCGNWHKGSGIVDAWHRRPLFLLRGT